MIFDDDKAPKQTMRVRMKLGYYAGEIRELQRDVALELLALGRVEFPDKDAGEKAAGAGSKK